MTLHIRCLGPTPLLARRCRHESEVREYMQTWGERPAKPKVACESARAGMQAMRLQELEVELCALIWGSAIASHMCKNKGSDGYGSG